jgi:hypothetical protein
VSRVRRGPMAADRYTTVSNAFARDARLSFKARGVGLWLFSQAEGWELSIRSIAAQNGCGTEAVMTALQELEKYGYLRREPQSRDGGRFGDVEYVVTDLPTVSGKPAHGDGVPENRVRADRVRETGTHKKTKFQEDQGKEDQQRSSSPDGDGVPDDEALFPAPKPTAAQTRAVTDASLADEFENQFWPAYPRRVGKNAALASYRRVRRGGVTVEELMAGVRRFAQEKANTEARFIAHASTWLNGGRWMDEPDPTTTTTPSSGPPAYQDADYWSSDE